MKKGQKIQYRWNNKIKTGIIEWIEPENNKMPYRKIKFTNGNVITDSSLI